MVLLSYKNFLTSLMKVQGTTLSGLFTVIQCCCMLSGIKFFLRCFVKESQLIFLKGGI